jgi:hypothetical protein
VIRRGIFANVLLAGALFALASPASFSQRLHLSPHFTAGQIVFYRIEFKSSRHMNTESRVASPQLSPTTILNASGLLQVQVVQASASGLLIKTYYSEREPSPASSPSPAAPSSASSADKVVEVSIASDGSASQPKGLDKLSPSQQLAWKDWLGRFTSSMAFPKAGISAGQKWELTEPEATASPIAGLVWSKKFQYVRDEPCPVSAQLAPSTSTKSPPSAQSCAVILVRATLRQKSSQNNSSPHDYKLQNLKTRGRATGQNETILYISRTDGVLVRAIEDTRQFMDATIALVDDSNQVHYILDAASRSEIALLPDSPQDAR